MEVWNRERLYAEVWEQPLIKVAEKHRISDVTLGKVCRKLQIPLPGRGYWAKKQAGEVMKRTKLPKARNLPTLRYYQRHETPEPAEPVTPVPEPTDPEYLWIKEVESRSTIIGPTAPRRHKLVVATDRAHRHATPDTKGMLSGRWDQPSIDIRVSRATLDRALNLCNAIIEFLETEGFQAHVKDGTFSATANIFGQEVPFSLIEKYKQKKHEIDPSKPRWSEPAYDFLPSGVLEFRIGEDRWGGTKFRDGKREQLEQMLPQLVGALMRDARERILKAEHDRIAAIEKRKRDIELMELRDQINKEEEKIKQLMAWNDSWLKARQLREFISALEKVWTEQGLDLSPEAEKGKRIRWMKDQADRLDPMIENPVSILDRKGELSRYY